MYIALAGHGCRGAKKGDVVDKVRGTTAATDVAPGSLKLLDGYLTPADVRDRCLRRNGKFRTQRIVFINCSCYGGAWAEAFKGVDRRHGIIQVRAETTSDQPCFDGVFLSAWMASLRAPDAADMVPSMLRVL